MISSIFSQLKAGMLGMILFLAVVPRVFSAEISLPDQSAAPPGSSIVVPVTLSSQDEPISGIQFDLQWDSAAVGLTDVALGDAARNSAKRLYFIDLATNQRRFLIVGFNQNAIPEGILIQLFVNLNPNAPNGEYPVTFSNVVATDLYGRSIAAVGVDAVIAVQGALGDRAPLQATGVLNAGSLLPGPLAPGEVVTLMGSGIGPPSFQQPAWAQSSTVLAGTSVFFDGIPAPLRYVAPNLINLVVPWGISGRPATQLQITYHAQIIEELLLPVAAAAPAIFTMDSSGVGPGVILNQDSTLNSPLNPAEPGSVITLFTTGTGEMDPPGTDGQLGGNFVAKPLLPVSVQIGGLNAPAQSAGWVPEMITGFIQVKCIVPMPTPSGSAIPIVLTIGETGSQAGVTLAIR